ncbi:thiamine pyrophosphate-dependent enzyme [Candidatus Pelagibacter sp.]|nr:thiamine pyrophosphate-dependent enzyme [Candidatus Pelagibacter sp.]
MYNKKKLHTEVLLLRSCQHVVNELMKKKKLKIPPHMAFGHEANAIGLKSVFKKNDSLVLTHRNIAFNIGFDLKNFRKFLHEFNLKKSGINNGKNGSMNIINPKKGIKYTSSILGNNFSIGVGISIYNKIIDKNRNFTYIVTGDGAMEEGTFSEVLIISKKFETNLLIIVENNDFAMASTIKQRRKNISLKKLVNSYGGQYLKLDSRNVIDYHDKLKKFKLKINKKGGPGVVEVFTTMFNRHAGATPGWPEDPIKINLSNGLEIKSNNKDPVFVSKKVLSKSLIDKIKHFANTNLASI